MRIAFALILLAFVGGSFGARNAIIRDAKLSGKVFRPVAQFEPDGTYIYNGDTVIIRMFIRRNGGGLDTIGVLRYVKSDSTLVGRGTIIRMIGITTGDDNCDTCTRR